MEVKDDYRKRTTKDKPGCKDSEHENIPGSVGDVPSSSAKNGVDQRGASGKNSNESITVTNCGYSLDGGIVSQLIKDAEDELAFYREQSKRIEIRLQKLNKLRQENQ